jgi:hypothetical protein
MNEFIDLIFTTNEALDIDMGRASQLIAFPKDAEESAGSVIDDIKK